MGLTAYAQRPDTWREHDKHLCAGCWAACCTLPVEARVPDLVRLGLMDAAEADWPLEPVIERLLRKKLIEAYDPKRAVFMLAQVSGRDCVFLHPEERTCTVYEKRPDTCRNFPRIGPRPGFCPCQAKP